MDGRSRDAVNLSDLAQAPAMLTVLADRFAIKLERWTSDVTAFELRPPHAAAHSFDDQAAFRFRDRADDHDDCAAQRAARVDAFTERHELDVEPVQLVQHLEEVPGGACDSIARPDQQGRTLRIVGTSLFRAPET